MLTGGNSETLDVRKVVAASDYMRTDNLLDPLFFQVPGGVSPGLATSAEPNKDATVWTLKLRDGVKWHDGKPFTADDVLFTMRNWASTQSSYKPTAESVIDIRNVRKLDKLTVQVPLVRPFGDLPGFLSWFSAYVIQNGTTNFNQPVGTGPFVYKSFQPGSQSTFTANPNYWQGAPYVDELVINTSFTDDSARLNALLAKQLDIAPLVPASLAKANASSGQIKLGNAPGPGFVTITCRVDQAPFNDPRVMQALKLLIKRDEYVTNAFDGYATRGNDLPGATLKNFLDVKAEYDPEKAKALLKAAGQENFAEPLLSSPAIPGMMETATLWQTQAAEIGLRVPIQKISPSVYYTSTPPGYATPQRKFSTTYWSVVPPSLGSFYLLALTKGAQYPETGWGLAPGQSTLIDAALAEPDPSKAEGKWQAAQEQQLKEGGYIIPANFNSLDAYAPNVHGVVTNSAGTNANFKYFKGWLA